MATASVARSTCFSMDRSRPVSTTPGARRTAAGRRCPDGGFNTPAELADVCNPRGRSPPYPSKAQTRAEETMDIGFETIGNATLICHDQKPMLVTDPWFVGPAYFGSWTLSHEIPEQQRQAILG